MQSYRPCYTVQKTVRMTWIESPSQDHSRTFQADAGLGRRNYAGLLT